MALPVCYFCPNAAGYSAYRSVIHQCCLTGVLHGLFMPVAAAGFIMVLVGGVLFFANSGYALAATRLIKNVLLLLFLQTYLTFDPTDGTLTVILYYLVSEYTLGWLQRHFNSTYYPRKSRRPAMRTLIVGIMLLVIAVLVMEGVGHWHLEQHRSDLRQVFNSILHTPLYGFKSLWQYPTRQGECWRVNPMT